MPFGSARLSSGLADLLRFYSKLPAALSGNDARSSERSAAGATGGGDFTSEHSVQVQANAFVPV